MTALLTKFWDFCLLVELAQLVSSSKSGSSQREQLGRAAISISILIMWILSARPRLFWRVVRMCTPTFQSTGHRSSQGSQLWDLALFFGNLMWDVEWTKLWLLALMTLRVTLRVPAVLAQCSVCLMYTCLFSPQSNPALEITTSKETEHSQRPHS